MLRCVHTIQLHVLIHSIWHHGTTALSDHCTFPCNAEATCAISFFLGLTSWNPPCVVSKGKLKVPTYQSNQSTVSARATGGLSVGFRVTKRPQLWSFSRMWCVCVEISLNRAACLGTQRSQPWCFIQNDNSRDVLYHQTRTIYIYIYTQYRLHIHHIHIQYLHPYPYPYLY